MQNYPCTKHKVTQWVVERKLHSFVTLAVDGSLWLSWTHGRFNPGRKAPGTRWRLDGSRNQSGGFEEEKNVLPVFGMTAGILGCQFLAQTLWQLSYRSSMLVTVHLFSILGPCVWWTPVGMNQTVMSKTNVGTEPAQRWPCPWTRFCVLFIHSAASQQTSPKSVLIFNLGFQYFVMSYFEPLHNISVCFNVRSS